MPTINRIPAGKHFPRKTKSNSSLSLPEEPNTPPSSLSDYCVCLYGAKGIGKTSLAAQLPDSLVFMLEPRRRNLRIRQVPKEGEPLDWPTIKSYLELAVNSDSVSSIVIDTIDRAYEACFEHVCKENNCSHPNEKKDYGQTWSLIRKEFEVTFNAILYAGKPLWFLSHAHTRDADEPVKEERFEQCIPTCVAAAYRYMKAVCDFAFYYGYVQKKRAITVRGEGLVWTGAGTSDNFLDPEGHPLHSFFVGDSPEQAYADLQSAFNNELYDTSYTPPLEEGRVKRKTKS